MGKNKVDVFINGFNFGAGILTFASLKSGLKVAIKMPYKFEFTFQPELSNFYPMAVVDSIQSLSNFNFFMKLSALFPNHFFPQRVLSFNSQRTYKRTLNNTFDKLLKRDREIASLPVNTEKYKAYHNFSKKYSHGSLLYEYRFDRNRAIMDLLKLCVENGATLVRDKSELDYGIELNCKPIDRNSFSIDIENFKWPYPNSFHLEQKNFNITFQGVKNKTIVQIYICSSEMNINEFKKDVVEIFKNLSLPISDHFDYQLENIFINNKSQNKINIEEVVDPKLNELRNKTMNLIKSVSSILGKKIDINKTWQTYRGNEMRNEKYRLIQTECDEKFDLAKQTGISYDNFILLFYRYRNQIDNMIESAYEIMNKERDTEIIWSKVERDIVSEELGLLNHS